jgi:hypothetical protein
MKIAGLVLGAGIIGTGQLRLLVLRDNVRAIKAECLAQSEKEKASLRDVLLRSWDAYFNE